MSSTASIDKILSDAVDNGDVPNVVAIAADGDGIVYEGAAGPRAAGSSEPASADTHFRIMSMTKMVTTAAALRLADEGKIELDAPVERYRPEFADVKVLTGFDGDTPQLRAPASQATIRQLMTHTSGLSYWFWNSDIVKWEAATGTPNVLSGQNVVFTAPMIADPGTTVEYGTNTDWLGRVVEAVSGTTLDKYFAEHITGPLGMTETSFAPTAAQRANLAPIHVRGEDGGWLATDINIPEVPEYWAGGHGLYSTPRDYLKFQRMLLGGGTLDGTKVLEKSTVDAAFTNQIGDLKFPERISTADPASSHDFAAGPGYRWGLGLLLNGEQATGMRAAGSGTWAGLCNSFFWVDRETGVTGAIYSQSLPFVPPPFMKLYEDFERALYATL
ncbi:serine hydrolase [Amycolatopsis sp. FDAARGOS 1241]|uniref:serine hydrolase domain-containing protein n=1 Tax=Amycolatopsis sp. FDAARGOS 1241 TaxID=2778070 RepID=UPI00195132D6|nr:serine hydrolase domain-containing protein [Amycolatopsis sp. FDAARGOS 1241]QRP49584.1 beta-lactamase family protein [Amycolatopsis sp. FDAARGOS 1241]